MLNKESIDVTNGPPVLFVLGPSGAGKTTLGQFIAEDLDFLWIEIDAWLAPDPIDIEELRIEWDRFLNTGQAAELATALRMKASSKKASGIVLTFPSMVVFYPTHFMGLERTGINVVVLYGSQQDCLAAFLRRERILNRNLTEDYWKRHNTESHRFFSEPSYAPYRLMAFQDGEPRSRAELMAAVRERISRVR
jgi:adenylate kinase family enzyme